MISYRTRLVSSLYAGGSDEDTIREALASLNGEQDEDYLIKEFGEPEVYASNLQEPASNTTRPHRGAALIGAILAVIVILGGILRQMGHLAWLPDWPMFVFLLIAVVIVTLIAPVAFISSMAHARRLSKRLDR